jgi:DNA transformation protein
MPVSASYRAWIEETLGRVEPVRGRGMFGGLGLYARERFFGLVDDDVLYFKVDDGTRADYDARAMPPFRPYGPEGPAMAGYRQVPGDVLEDPDALEAWMQGALEVAERARARTGPAVRRGR